jgi:hypothetical protein
MNVIGTQGQLFSVDDNLIGVLMSVNDITGLPVLEVTSDYKITMGAFNRNALVVSGSSVGIGVQNNGATYRLISSGDTLFSGGTMTVRGAGTTSATNAIVFQNSSGGTMALINNAGNLLIGTSTDNGYKLRVENSGVFIKGAGTTSSTTSFLIQDNSGTQIFKTSDDGVSVIGDYTTIRKYTAGGTTMSVGSGGHFSSIVISATGGAQGIYTSSRLGTYFNNTDGASLIADGTTTYIVTAAKNVGIRTVSMIIGTSSNNMYEVSSLQVDSTTGGFLPPRMTTSQKNNLTSIERYIVLTAGSGYTNTTHYGGDISGGTGTKAHATIVVSGGQVSSITPLDRTGRGYQTGDIVSATGIGAGTGFTAYVVTSGVTGMTVYDLTKNTLEINDGTTWQTVASQAWVQSQGYITGYTDGDTLQIVSDRGKVTTSLSSTGTTLVASATTGYTGVFFNYTLGDGTSYRAGTVTSVVSSGSTVEFTETSTNDIGNTSPVSLSVGVGGGFINLSATTTTTGWTIKVVPQGI